MNNSILLVRIIEKPKKINSFLKISVQFIYFSKTFKSAPLNLKIWNEKMQIEFLKNYKIGDSIIVEGYLNKTNLKFNQNFEFTVNRIIPFWIT